MREGLFFRWLLFRRLMFDMLNECFGRKRCNPKNKGISCLKWFLQFKIFNGDTSGYGFFTRPIGESSGQQSIELLAGILFNPVLSRRFTPVLPMLVSLSCINGFEIIYFIRSCNKINIPFLSLIIRCCGK